MNELATFIQDHWSVPDDPFEGSEYQPIASLRSSQSKNARGRRLAADVLRKRGYINVEGRRGRLYVNNNEFAVRLATGVRFFQWAQLHPDGPWLYVVLIGLQPESEHLWIVPKRLLSQYVTGSTVGRTSNPYFVLDVEQIPDWLEECRRI